MTSVLDVKGHTNLNAICPYFTMFPLSFPLGILERHSHPQQVVLDPFCGRGTANYAARLMGLYSVGIDASPVAVAATKAKLTTATPDEIVAEAKNLLSRKERDIDIPEGEFWELAYHRDTLRALCVLRNAMLSGLSDDRIGAALSGIILGGLHGPLRKDGSSSYFSNQCPRTYGPKPRYAVKFWKSHDLRPPKINVLQVIKERAERFYFFQQPEISGDVIHGDSREKNSFSVFASLQRKADWIITSPPYYGLKTYLPDQWLRNWFLGGAAEVDYSSSGQLSHNSLADFEADLRKVWNNAGLVSAQGARLVIRFGAIRDRKIRNPTDVIKRSLKQTPWRIVTARNAGTASSGKRQAITFQEQSEDALMEFDVWAVYEG